MKKRQNILIFPLLIMGVFLVFASSCEKDDNNEQPSGNSTNGKTTAVFNPDVTYGTMTDKDGNIYKTVTIGTQTWMAENLRTTKYNDGTSILNVTDKNEWVALKTGAYCNYDNTTSIDKIATYGRLYNWYAINTGKLAPIGWHVPSDAEWIELIVNLNLGGKNVAGDKLKETGTTHWNINSESTNETGFTALPGGYRNDYGSFYDIGFNGDWWSATESNATDAWFVGMYYGSDIGYVSNVKEFGFSVRCVRN